MTRIACLLLTLILVAGCSSREPITETNADGPKLQITDQRGQTVTLDGPATKVAFAVIPAPSIFAAVDRSYDRVVGINASTRTANQSGLFGQMYPQSTKSEVIAGSDFVPNVETISRLDPDVVVQWGHRGDAMTQPIEAAGYPVVGLRYGTQEDLETWIRLFSEIIDKPERGAELIAWQRSEAAAMRQTTAAQSGPRPRALILSKANGTYSVTSGAGYDGFQFDLVRAELASAEVSAAQPQVSPEQLIDWDPEVIFLSGFDTSAPKDIYADRRLAGISAVKNRRVYKTPLGAYRWQVPSMESPLMWEWMNRLLYPGERGGQFRAKIQTTIDDLYGYEVSPEQIDQILRLDLNEDAANYQQFER